MLAKQLEIYQRTDPKLNIKRTDRMFFSLMMEWLSNWKEKMFIVKPGTVIKWHRTAFKLYWRWKSQHKEGRPKVSREVIALIKEMANENSVLDDYGSNYNKYRPHLGINKDSRDGRSIQSEGEIDKIPIVNGLHHVYFRKAA